VHGLVADLDRRLDDQELDLPTRHLAKLLARELDGRPPLGAASRLRGTLCEAWGGEQVERALVALGRAGYGHGSRLERSRLHVSDRSPAHLPTDFRPSVAAR
jgi:hypothetical protein